MQHHTVKKINPYFNDMWQGSLTFDVRWNDRNFQVGDMMTVQEFDPNGDSGARFMLAEITYILTSDDFPHTISAGCVVMSLVILKWCQVIHGTVVENNVKF